MSASSSRWPRRWSLQVCGMQVTDTSTSTTAGCGDATHAKRHRRASSLRPADLSPTLCATRRPQMEKRGADGHIVPFASKFPSGMRALGDKIHALGLKFGIYSCAGKTTCEGWPGSYGYEEIDAADYAAWGVDYLKYDYCGFEKVDSHLGARHYYTIMRDALNATVRPDARQPGDAR